MIAAAVSLCWSALTFCAGVPNTPTQLITLVTAAVAGAVPSTPTELVTLTTAAVAGLLLILIATQLIAGHSRRAGSPVRAVALRQRARRAAFLRLRDPGAAGRQRPRAPSVRPRTA
jgi:Family of unknown function (DUF6412)